jgi:hypothetical protein
MRDTMTGTRPERLQGRDRRTVELICDGTTTATDVEAVAPEEDVSSKR